MRAANRLACLILTCVAVPALALAQDTASLHFPTDANCTGPNTCNVENSGAAADMDVTVVASGVPNIKTNSVGSIDLVAGDTGPVTAAKAVNKVCLACAGAGGGVTVSGFIVGPGACAGAACCATTSAQTVVFSCLGAGPRGFDLTRSATADSFTVAPNGAGGNIQNLNCRTSVGNSNGPDLLERVLLQVRPNGINGSVTIDVYHTQSPPNPRSITVNTSSFPDTAALHSEITTQLNLLSLGLRAVHHSSSEAGIYSGASETFAGANFVEIVNARTANVTKVELDGLPGQTLVTETADPVPSSPAVPALSAWGMVALVSLLAMSTLWLLRRGGRRSEA